MPRAHNPAAPRPRHSMLGCFTLPGRGRVREGVVFAAWHSSHNLALLLVCLAGCVLWAVCSQGGGGGAGLGHNDVRGHSGKVPQFNVNST